MEVAFARKRRVIKGPPLRILRARISVIIKRREAGRYADLLVYRGIWNYYNDWSV
jgi:hypothetical protein